MIRILPSACVWALLLCGAAVELFAQDAATKEADPARETPYTPRPVARPTGDETPAAPREFRAAWVASVGDSQWPSRAGLTVEQQQREMLDILHRCAALRLNAVILKVRPNADAL